MLNGDNGSGQAQQNSLAYQQWGLSPIPQTPDTVGTLRYKLTERANELRKRIQTIDADRAELAEIEAMLAVNKVPT